MQQSTKEEIFKKAVGAVITEARASVEGLSINKFAAEYDFDKGNISKTEKGVYNIYLMTAWRLSEALGITFVEFASRLQEKLGKDFKFIDE